METYNGWTNFETWKINLEFGLCDGGFEEYNEEMLKEFVEEYIENNCEDNMLQGWLYDFTSEVNWNEIYNHIQEDNQ